MRAPVNRQPEAEARLLRVQLPSRRKVKIFFLTQNLLPCLKVSALGHSTKPFQNGFRFNRKPFELCFDPTAALRLFLVRQNKSYMELVSPTRSRSPGAGGCPGPCSPLPGPSLGEEGAPQGPPAASPGTPPGGEPGQGRALQPPQPPPTPDK